MTNVQRKSPTLKALILSLMAGGAVLSLNSLAEARGGPNGQRPAFEEIDADGNGAVTPQELQAHMASRGQARFAEADTNGDGALTLEEMTAAAQGRAADRANRMFERLDTDSDGRVTRAEIEAHQAEREGKRGHRGSGRMFERADADNNGSLSAEEWAAIPEKRGRR